MTTVNCEFIMVSSVLASTGAVGEVGGISFTGIIEGLISFRFGSLTQLLH